MSQDPVPPPTPPSPTYGAVHNHGPSQQGTGNVQNNYFSEGRDDRLDLAVVLLWSPEDEAAVRPRVIAMSALYRLEGDLSPRLAAPSTPEARAALRAELKAAKEVWVFWSAGARRSPFVQSALALIAEIEAAERAAEPPSPQEKTRLVTVPLDDTMLMDPLKRPKAIERLTGDHPVQAALYSGLNLLGGLGAFGLGVWGSFDGFQGPLWWAAVVGLVALALAIGVAQLTRRAELVLTAGEIYQRGAWLARATVEEILAVSERMLNRIYGEKLVSLRSFAVSALVGTGTVFPLIILWSWSATTPTPIGLLRVDVWVMGLFAAALTVPLALLNILFDFLALVTTRKILHSLLLDARGARVALGLVLDAALVGAAATLPFVLNVPARRMLNQEGESFTNPFAVGSHLLLLLTGGLHLENLGSSFIASGLVLPALSVFTGYLPSLVHGGLLLVAGLNRGLGGAPLRLLGWALRGLADRPAGPQEALVPLGTLLLGAWTALAHLGSGEPPSAGWVSVPQETCAENCMLPTHKGYRRPVDSSKRDLRAHPVQLHTHYEIQSTELTQGQWARVMQKAKEANLKVWSLPDQPSVYRGEHLPVDSVSWCEAARFANLWSRVEGLPPAYSVGNPPEGEDRYGLPGCELHVEVIWDLNSIGYRLPTDVEWEVAARECRPGHGCSAARYVVGYRKGDLLRAAWVRTNSGWRPHAVASREPNALGLYDMLGNVWEWTSCSYPPDPAAGLNPLFALPMALPMDLPRRKGVWCGMRGGSWYDDDVDAAGGNSNGPGYSHEQHGFRLVRSVGPSPSGSGP